MATKKINAYNVNKNWKIYIFTFPLSNNIYVDCTSQKNLRTVYKDHNMLKFGLSKPYFKEAKIKKIKPEMYLLEEFNSTKNIAYSRMVAWGKILTDMGFYCVNGDTFRSYIEDLIERTQAFYDEISIVNVQELISPEKNLVADYKPRKTKNKKNEDYTIHISVTAEENKIIEKRAAAVMMNKTAYCKQISLNGYINNLNFHVSDEYLKELREAISVVKQSIVTIYNLGQYFPEDLTKIEELKNIIVKHYKDTVKESIKVNAALSNKGRKKNKQLNELFNDENS